MAKRELVWLLEALLIDYAISSGWLLHLLQMSLTFLAVVMQTFSKEVQAPGQ